MFNKDFYPTPKSIIKKMVEGITKGKILEPSAGKGDILDYLKENNSNIRHYSGTYRRNYYAIEKDRQLQHIIRDKEYNLIDTDFLSFQTDIFFDYIIMNPPFSDGDKHLLKAWEISNGAEIRCLLNAETINNPYSKTRQLLKEIIEKNGTVENLGNCFADAERKTGVETVLVILKDKEYKSNFEFNCREQEQKVNFDNISTNEIARKDEFQNLEVRYTKVRSIMQDLVKNISELSYYGDDILSERVSIQDLFKRCSNFYSKSLFSDFMAEFKKEAWKSLFKKTKIEKIVTSKLRKQFYNMQEQNSTLAFSKANMETILRDLMFSQDSIMQDCIEDAFDLMTKHYKENRVHIEGWKTNDQWQVNRKVIIPNALSSFSRDCRFDYTTKDKLIDIEKGLCFIAKKNIDSINSIVEAQEENQYFGTWIDSEFFEFKVFKKETLHLKFKDEWLYKEFNLQACKSKNWLKGV